MIYPYVRKYKDILDINMKTKVCLYVHPERYLARVLKLSPPPHLVVPRYPRPPTLPACFNLLNVNQNAVHGGP